MGGSATEPREQQLRALLDAVTDGLVLCGGGGRIAWANPALATLAGLEGPEKLAGRALADLFEEADLGLLAPAFRGPVECHLVVPGSGSRRVLVDRLGLPAGDAEAALRVRDVSELSARSAEVLRMARALQRANRECADLRERLRRDAAAREQLLTVVSHELRTPVTVIAGYNRLLLAGKVGPLNPEQEHFVQESQKSCQRLNQFIGNLLERARGLMGEGVLELHDAPLAPAIQAVVGLLTPLLREHRLEVGLALPPDLPPARFDPLRLEQVLTNLLDNAIKFAPAGSRLEISARAMEAQGEPWLEVAVADRGPGVPDADRERIFEAYAQAEAGRGGGGLGLGLAICRRIVEAHGGRIGAEPRAGGGSRFVFTLPAADARPGARA